MTETGAAAPSESAADDGFAGWVVASGSTRAVGANRPFEISGERAWFVRVGVLDLFLQPTDGTRVGRRHLLCTAPSGALVWSGGKWDLPPGWRMVAVGHADTEVVELGAGQLAAGPTAEDVARRVEAFVGYTRAGRLDGSVARSDGGGDAPAARLTRAHERFQAVVSDRIAGTQEQDVRDAERIGSQLDREYELVDHALVDLVEIVDRREPLGRVSGDRSAQLDVALARIGRALRVDFSGYTDLGEQEANPVMARITHAGCRARVTTLREGWWKRTGAVMLGFLAEDDSPVALIPGRGRYQMFNPSTGVTRRLDQNLAGRIGPESYMVYRPLPPDAGSLRSLARSVLPFIRGDLWMLLGLGVLGGLITLITPLVTGLVYGNVLPDENDALLWAISALLIGATITWGLVALSRNLVTVRIQGQLEMTLDPGLIDRLLQLPSNFFRRYETGELATRTNGLQVIRQQLSGAVVTSSLALVFSLFNVVLLFFYSALLGIASLATIAAVIAILTWLNVIAVRHQYEVFTRSGNVASELFQMIRGVHKMRVAGAEPRLMARWASLFRLQQQEVYAAGKNQAWVFAVVTVLPAAVSLTLYAIAGTVLVHDISPGDFMAIVTALGQFGAAVVGITLTLGSALTVIPLWQQLQPILREPLEEMGVHPPRRLSGAISVKSVTFAYDDDSPNVIEDVSFDVRPGEFVAITGPSGSGKSTLLRLLLGLDHPTSGAVLLDGRDMRSLDTRAVRAQCGVVMQGARPLPGEILSTILGESGGTDDEAWAAAEAADLADDIRKMPMQMHTIIGEGGLAFSGGQVQRMMIARAIARRPRILFFDEATSALDDRAQAVVSRHIEALDSTRVIVAHRLSTIRRANTIYVVEGGRITQSGDLDSLLASDGPFRRLAARQLV